jgi:hypothetical protein
MDMLNTRPTETAISTRTENVKDVSESLRVQRSISNKDSTELPIQLETISSHHPISVTALLDSGATAMFIDHDFVKSKNMTTDKLPRAISIFNIDGSQNSHGSIKETVDLIVRYQDHTERATFYVTSLGNVPVILGHPWLSAHNPQIDWKTGEVSMLRCPSTCRIRHIQLQRKRRERSKLQHSDKPPLPTVEEIDEEAPSKPESPVTFPVLEKGDRVMCAMLSQVQARATSTVSQRLAEAANDHLVTQSFRKIVPRHYQRFEHVFLKESFDELPMRKKWDHVIELIPGSKEFSTKLYPMSPNEQGELDKFLDENLKSGRIRPSKSPMASPVFFVKKKDGSLRFVQDYRKLNAITIKNRYPLPLIPDIMLQVAGAKFFTKLDVRWGYNNIRIREGDEWKAAFRTNRGLFEPLVMFFGLCNSPATFQTMMNDIFRELIEEGVIAVYMDDILIFTKTLEEHRQIVNRVLQILKDNHLFLKPDKCTFEVEKIEFLGLILSENQVEMDPIKIKGVLEWPVPRKVKELQSFLGFINFYRRFIEDFSKVARPLHDLTRKDAKWVWEEKHQEAFEILKTKITSAPILVQPDVTKPFKLETDASDFATGAVLSQLCDDEKWRPVGFLSKSLNPAERNYEIHDKELLSVIRGLEEWRHLLEGAMHTFDIYNDHRNLKYFMESQNLNRRQARWSLFLSRFYFTMHHKPGKSSGKPDALSRRADHELGEPDNTGQTLLPPQYFQTRAIGELRVHTIGDKFVERIKECSKRDDIVAKALQDPKTLLRNEEWLERDNVVFHNGKVYVPKDDGLRHDIVQAHHDAPTAGHPGRWKTLDLVTRNYWWPGVSRYISQYVKGCDKCNRAKTYPAAPMGRLTPNSIPERRWEVVTTDLITGLPESHGFDSIWVTVDRLTKRIHIAPTTKEVDSLGLARLFRDHVWRNHGLPDQIISDRGPQFVSAFTRELNQLLGIKTSLSTAFHPQTDGQTERVNQEIETYLRIFVNQRQDDWSEWLPLAEFAFNNRVHSATRRTPFELDSGQHPRMGTEPRRETKLEAVEMFVDRIKKATEEAQAALQQAAKDMARYHNSRRGKNVKFKVGDQVWLDARNIKTTRPAKKLDDKWFGPFPVLKVISDNVYKLKLTPPFSRVHPVFNITVLRKFNPDEIASRPKRSHPDPVIDEEGEVAYEVESILDSRHHRGRTEYLVSWKGYGPEHNSWEPEHHLKGASRLVREFHRNHPGLPGRISSLAWEHFPFHRYMDRSVGHRPLYDWRRP